MPTVFLVINFSSFDHIYTNHSDRYHTNLYMFELNDKKGYLVMKGISPIVHADYHFGFHWLSIRDVLQAGLIFQLLMFVTCKGFDSEQAVRKEHIRNMVIKLRHWHFIRYPPFCTKVPVSLSTFDTKLFLKLTDSP
ncbi:hypothetical protein [Bacillus sp. S14(2024)]|uniref:hypothetical protein n=1 Tax=Bacillus sp. S14(2024) TaxID=3162884 RepID=UPI003D194EA6